MVKNFLSYYNRKEKWNKQFNWAPALDPLQRVKSNKATKINYFKHKSDLKKEGLLQFNKELKNIHLYLNNEGKLTNKIGKVRKTFPIYSLNKIGSNVYQCFRKVGISGFKEFFSINKTNRICGFTPDHIGFRHGKELRFNNIYVNYFKNNFDKIKLLREVNPKLYNDIITCINSNRVVFTGSPDTNMNHLKNFTKDNKGLSKYSVDEKVKIALKSDWFKTPTLEFDDPTEIYTNVNFNPKASVGLMCKKILSKCGHKASISWEAYSLARSVFNVIRKFPLKNVTLWEILSREKDFKIKEGLNEYSTRVIMNPEFHMSILYSWVFQKLQIATQYDNNIKYHLKDEFNYKKASHLIKKLKNYDWCVAADWRKFDSEQDTDDLKIVGSLLFSNSLREGNKSDYRFFFHIVSSFITKYIAIPPGIVVELNRGNPSGHPGVTMVNCFSNLLRWSLIGYELYGDNYHEMMDIEVYGDDAYVMFKDCKKLKDIDTIIKDLGYESDPIYDTLFPTKFVEDSIPSDDTPDFLKRKFNYYSIYWNRSKVLDKIFYQSKKRSPSDQIELVINYILTGPGDNEFNSFFLEVLKDLIKKFRKDILDDKLLIFDKQLLDIENMVFETRYFNKTQKDSGGVEKVLCSSKAVIDTTAIDYKGKFITLDKINFILVNSFSKKLLNTISLRDFISYQPSFGCEGRYYEELIKFQNLYLFNNSLDLWYYYKYEYESLLIRKYSIDLKNYDTS